MSGVSVPPLQLPSGLTSYSTRDVHSADIPSILTSEDSYDMGLGLYSVSKTAPLPTNTATESPKSTPFDIAAVPDESGKIESIENAAGICVIEVPISSASDASGENSAPVVADHVSQAVSTDSPDEKSPDALPEARVQPEAHVKPEALIQPEACAGWARFFDEVTQCHYEYNADTGETRWGAHSPLVEERPVAAESAVPGDGGWFPYFDLEGNKYFYNEGTGEYSWLLPDASPVSADESATGKCEVPQHSLGPPPASDWNIPIRDDVSVNSDSAALMHSSDVETSLLLLKLNMVNEELRGSSDAPSDEEAAADRLIASIRATSIALEWHWPWTTLFCTVRRAVFFLHEVSGTLQLDRPFDSDPHYVFGASRAASLRRHSSEVLSRTLYRRGGAADVAGSLGVYNLAALVFASKGSAAPALSKPRISGPSVGGALMLELLAANDTFECAPRHGTRKSDERIAEYLQQKLSGARPPSSPSHLQAASSLTSPSRVFASPSKSRGATASPSSHRPPPAAASSRSPGSVSPALQHTRGLSVKSVAYSILAFLDERPNFSLREKIHSKHIFSAVRRQRQLLESFVPSASQSESAGPIPPRSAVKSAIDARPLVAQSLERIIALHRAERASVDLHDFEKALSASDFARYSLHLEAIKSFPGSAAVALSLVECLLRCSSSEAAIGWLNCVTGNIRAYRLTAAEEAYVRLVEYRCKSRFLGVFAGELSLKEMAARFPRDSGLLALVARELHIQQSDDAEVFYIAALVRDPCNTIALRGYGHLRAARDDYVGGIKLLARVSASADSTAADLARLEVAWCSELLGNSDSITAHYYSKVLHQSCAKHVQSYVHCGMGVIALHRKDAAAAEASFVKAVHLCEDNPLAAVLYCCHAEKSWDRSLCVKQRFLRAVDGLRTCKSPSLWMAHLGYGDFAAFVLNDYAAAERAYRSSISASASSLAVCAYVHMLGLKKDRSVLIPHVEWALHRLRSARGAEDVSEVLVVVAHVLAEAGHLDRADALLDEVVGAGVRLSCACRCKALVSLARGDEEGAGQAFEEALHLGLSNPYTLRCAAAHLATRGDYPRALSCIASATSLDSLCPQAWTMHAMLTYMVVGDVAECIDLLLVATKLMFDLDAHRLLGQLLFEVGRVDEAVVVLETVLGAHPRDCVTMTALVLCYDALRSQESGKSKEMFSSSPQVLNTAYQILIGGLLGRLEREVNQAADSAENVPSEVFYRLGMFYLSACNRNNSKAAKTARQMLVRGGKGMHPLCIFMLGWVAELDGNVQLAEDYYEMAVLLQPMDLLLLSKLQMLSASTHNYVKAISEKSKSKLAVYDEKRKVWIRRKRGVKREIANGKLSVRVLVHERICSKLQSIGSAASGPLKGSGRAFIDPLWASKMLLVFSSGESWAYIAKTSIK